MNDKGTNDSNQLNKDEILRNVTPAKVFAYYDIPIDKNIKSPFRDDDNNPSFRAYESGQWVDFAREDLKGDLINFVERIENTNFQGALKKIAEIGNMNLARPESNEVEKRKKFDLKPIPVYDMQTFTKRLLAGQPAYILNDLRSRGITDEIIIEYQIGTQKGKQYENLIIPYESDGNHITSYKKLRYNFDGTPAEFRAVTCGGFNIFPKPVLKSNKNIILCEGEKDALSLLSKGIPAVTGTAGAGTFKEEFADLFKDKKVTIIYDNDDAGRKGMSKAASILAKTATGVKQVEISSLVPGECKFGYDIGDYFTDGNDPEKIKALADFVPEPAEKKEVRKLKKAEKYEAFYDNLGDDETPKFKLNYRKLIKYIIENYQIICSRNGSRLDWYSFSDGYWSKVDVLRVHKIISDLMAVDHTPTTIKNAVELLSKEVLIDNDKFNSRSDLINLENCAFDLKKFSSHFTLSRTLFYPQKQLCLRFYSEM